MNIIFLEKRLEPPFYGSFQKHTFCDLGLDLLLLGAMDRAFPLCLSGRTFLNPERAGHDMRSSDALGCGICSISLSFEKHHLSSRVDRDHTHQPRKKKKKQIN